MPDELLRQPQIRAGIDAVEGEHEGKPVYILYDTSGLSQQQLVVSPAVIFLLGLCDGQRDTTGICQEAERRSGQAFSRETLDTILNQLDEALFLHSPRFTEHQQQVAEAFAHASVRESNCAGAIYPEDADELRASLATMIGHAPPPEEDISIPHTMPKGMIIPHIDYLRGAKAYGQAYKLLQKLPSPEVVVILGIAHRPTPGRYVLTGKDFKTPLGLVRNAKEICTSLLDSLPGDGLSGEIAHFHESSIELQLPFLQYLWGDSFQICPILCGSFHDLISSGEKPDAIPEVAALTSALKGLADEYGERLLFIASADLSHVGRHFGDDADLDDKLLKDVEEIDRAYLKLCAEGNADGAMQLLTEKQNRTEICSASAIHTYLKAVGEKSSQLCGYHQALNRELEQMVSFAAMISG